MHIDHRNAFYTIMPAIPKPLCHRTIYCLSKPCYLLVYTTTWHYITTNAKPCLAIMYHASLPYVIVQVNLHTLHTATQPAHLSFIIARLIPSHAVSSLTIAIHANANLPKHLLLYYTLPKHYTLLAIPNALLLTLFLLVYLFLDRYRTPN